VTDRHPLFAPLILVGGLLFGFGLAYSHMARPEVVLDFLQFEDFGLLFVMFVGAGVTGLAYLLAPRLSDRAPLTGDRFRRPIRATAEAVRPQRRRRRHNLRRRLGSLRGLSRRRLRQSRRRQRHHPLGDCGHVRRRVPAGSLAERNVLRRGGLTAQ